MRRFIVITIAALGLISGASAAQAVGGASAMSDGYWGCVGSEMLDRGVCLRNPVPERLPVPETPAVPTVPTV